MSYGTQTHIKIKPQNQTAMGTSYNLNGSKAGIRKEEINIQSNQGIQGIHMNNFKNIIALNTQGNVNNFNSKVSIKKRGKNISIGNITMNTNNFNVTGNSICINKKDPLNILSPKTKDELLNLQLSNGNADPFFNLRSPEASSTQQKAKKIKKESIGKTNKTFTVDDEEEKDSFLFDYKIKSGNFTNACPGVHANISQEHRQDNNFTSYMAFKSNAINNKISEGLNCSGVQKFSLSNYPSPKPLYNKIISQLKNQFKEITSKQNSKIEDAEPLSESKEKFEGLEIYNKISSTNPPSSHVKTTNEAGNEMNMNMLNAINFSKQNSASFQRKSPNNSQVRTNKVTSIDPGSNILINPYICQTENASEAGPEITQPSDKQRILTPPDRTIKVSNSKKISSKRNAGLSTSIIGVNTTNSSVIALNKSTAIVSTENVPDDVFFSDQRYTKLLAQVSSQREENERISTECRELKTLINILKELTKAHQTVFERVGKEKIVSLAHDQMKRLLERESMEKNVVFQQNRDLKLLVLKLYYQARRYEEEEVRMCKEYNKYMSQLLKENEYLRVVSENFTVSNSEVSNLKKVHYSDYKNAHRRNESKAMRSQISISVIDDSNNSTNKSIVKEREKEKDKDRVKENLGSSLFSVTLSEMSKTIKKKQNSISTTQSTWNERENFTKSTTKHKLKICYNKKNHKGEQSN